MMMMETDDEGGTGAACPNLATKSYSVEVYDRPGHILTLRVCQECYDLLRSSRR